MVDHLSAVAIRPAVAEDANGIARVYLESAEYHAGLDPERYATPAIDISARYREGRQHSSDADSAVTTLVADAGGEIVGFVDARIDRSADAMHREMSYCHISEIAVDSRFQKQGIGGRLLRAAEAWGAGLGATFASLEYHVANARAAVFYREHMGYRVAAITVIKPLG